MKALVSLGAVGVGAFLLLIGFLWGFIFPAANNWTEEKSQRMTELRTKAHQLMFAAAAAKERPNMQGGKNAAEAEAEYKSAQAELNALSSEFEGARDTPDTIGRYLRWAGMGLVLIGGVAVMAARGG